MYADDASHRSKGQEACIVDETSNKAYFDEDTGTFVTQSCSRRVDLARSDFALMQTLRRPFESEKTVTCLFQRYLWPS